MYTLCLACIVDDLNTVCMSIYIGVLSDLYVGTKSSSQMENY